MPVPSVSPQYANIGTLQMLVIKGKLLRNTEFFGQMDPYVQVETKGKTFKTQTIQEGGKNPVWNEAFVIPISSMDDELKITCFDEDLLVDDLVGSKVFKASELCIS